MPIKHTENQYTVPRGRAYWDPIEGGQYQGEVPFGTAPEFTFSVEISKAEHKSSETAETAIDKTKTTSVSRTGKVTVDNIANSNVILYLGADAKQVTIDDTPVADKKLIARPGRIYQLGTTPDNPLGIKNITDFSAKAEDGTTALGEGADFNIDLKNARLQILAGGLVMDGDEISVSYTPTAGKRLVISTGGEISKEGALRIVPDNADGPNRDWYFPKVTLSPDGDFALINTEDDFMAIDFSIDILKPANGSAVYVAGEGLATD